MIHRKWTGAIFASCVMITMLLLGVVPHNANAAADTLNLTAQPIVTVDNIDHFSDPIQAILTLSPAAIRPGETLDLRLSLTNTQPNAIAPNVTFSIPANLSLNLRGLPPATTLNVQTNTLSWHPVIRSGAEATLSLTLRADVADVADPLNTVSAELTLNNITYPLSADFWLGVAPQVTLLAPRTVSIGQTLDLVADVNGSGPLTYDWQLGDGRHLRVRTPNVFYSTAGTYEIILRAINPIGEGSARALVTVVPQPAAFFTLLDATPGVGMPTQFVDGSGGLGVLIRRWDFGDGTTSTETNPAHIYQQAGSYTVRLEVENDLGRATTTLPVFVGTPPVADMIIGDSAPIGQTVIGQAFGDETVTEYRWEMGDGHTIIGEQITYAYKQAGRFAVTLHAVNEYGETTITHDVEIQEGQLLTFLPMISSVKISELAPDEQYRLLIGEFEPLSLDLLQPPEGSSKQEQLLWYVNQARSSVKLQPLAFSPALALAAQAHADDMARAKFTAHTGSDGSHPWERQERYAFTGAYAGEATAWGFKQPADAVEFWANSPSHRVMLFNPLATEIGLGYTFDAQAPNFWYWTVEFGSTVNEHPLPAFPTPTPLPTPILTGSLTTTLPITLTATPTISVTALPTPTPLGSPTPLATAFPQAATPTPPPATPVVSFAVKTPKPTAVPTPTATPQPQREAVMQDPVQVVVAFLNAVSAETSGITAVDYISSSQAERLLTSGWPSAWLGFNPIGVGYQMTYRIDEPGQVVLWLELVDWQGAVYQRQITVASEVNAWRIIAIDPR